MKKALFPLGKVVATPGAIEVCNKESCMLTWLLMRHATGDPGELCADDVEANKQALIYGDRVFSSYKLPNTGVKVWVITEADRSVTTLLLPGEY